MSPLNQTEDSQALGGITLKPLALGSHAVVNMPCAWQISVQAVTNLGVRWEPATALPLGGCIY